MFIDIVPNRNSPPTILLRECKRIGKKIIKRTLTNLSHWSSEKVEALRSVLKGDYQKITRDKFVIDKSISHGHVQAILGTMQKIGLDEVLYSKPLRQRNLVIAMIAEQLIHPCSKLGYARILPGSTLLDELGLEQVTEDDLYEAMDWLYERQHKIEKKLARKHFSQGAMVLYDVTSSYYEGKTCSLAVQGHNRDKKKGKRIIVYGMMTDDAGCPVAVDVYAGNTADPSTVVDQAEKLQKRFGLKHIVLVGDRGMLTQTNIDMLKKYSGIGWISALRTAGIRKLINEGSLQLSLFDKQNIAEITSSHYPGERFIVCYNPFMAGERKRKREELLTATELGLNKIVHQVERRKKKLHTAKEIALMTGRIINRYKVGKHFELAIAKGRLDYKRKEEEIRKEAELDGFYVIRTSEPANRLSAKDTIRKYKSLRKVEKMYRTLKGVEILVRPIRHRNEQRVRAHIFLCMLAYYVQWHMKQKLASILFTDEETEKNTMARHPVSPAKPSLSVKKKKLTRVTPDGVAVHSFETLLTELAMRTRNICRIKTDQKNNHAFPVLSELSPVQRRTFELLEISTQ